MAPNLSLFAPVPNEFSLLQLYETIQLKMEIKNLMISGFAVVIHALLDLIFLFWNLLFYRKHFSYIFFMIDIVHNTKESKKQMDYMIFVENWYIHKTKTRKKLLLGFMLRQIRKSDCKWTVNVVVLALTIFRVTSWSSQTYKRPKLINVHPILDRSRVK